MGRPTIDIQKNFTDRLAKQDAYALIAQLEGPYHLKADPIDPKRSNQANAYYHAVPVRYFREFLAAQGQHFTHDQCHEHLRDRFLYRPPIFDPTTGEIIDYMPSSSAKLRPAEFYTFVEDVRDWLKDTFNIDTPDPSTWGVPNTASLTAGSAPQGRLLPCAPSTGDVGKRSTPSRRKEPSDASR